MRLPFYLGTEGGRSCPLAARAQLMFGPSSPYEKELLEIFGKLRADTQEFILDMARNLLKRQENPKNLPGG